LTDRGIGDLRDGVVRTPLDPLKTFIDDPLRVLRCIRFTQRFGFQISKDIYKAAQTKEVREAFFTKITFERITKEMDKMLESKSPHISIQQMYDFQITDQCIKAPEQISAFQGEGTVHQKFLPQSVHICNVLGLLFNTLKH